MEDQNRVLQEKIAKLLREAAEAKVALDRTDGKFKGVPHYSLIEDAAHELGCELSRMVQQMHMKELVANQGASGKCPTCGAPHRLEWKDRKVLSGDGPVELMEVVGYCTGCRKSFFPSPRNVGV
jgi:hypothetical protein